MNIFDWFFQKKEKSPQQKARDYTVDVEKENPEDQINGLNRDMTVKQVKQFADSVIYVIEMKINRQLKLPQRMLIRKIITLFIMD